MEGIVIKSIDYKEKSKLVYLYTPLGIRSVKALDVSKSKLGFITTLNQVEFEATTGKLSTVTEYTLLKSFYSFYQNLDKVGVLSPILDVILHLEEDANHTRIYPFFLRTLEALEQTNSPYSILSIFLIKMLSVFGIKPELKKCIHCSNTRIVNFSFKEGGALCANCSAVNEKNYAIYKAFYELYYTQDFNIGVLPLSSKEVVEAIYSYYSIHAHFKLKGYKL
ncbi:MAG: DNA repair protein RecO [Anaeroplasmataceae bacterium]|nr:DNA repair protein RecO [Anaeroplasmataceae bacterium]